MAKPGQELALVELVKGLARVGPETQILLDRRYRSSLRRLAGHLEEHQVPSDHPIARILMPSRIQVGEVKIEATLSLTARRERAVGVGLELCGRTVTSFFEALHGESVNRGVKLSMTVDQAPIVPQSKPSRQQT